MKPNPTDVQFLDAFRDLEYRLSHEIGFRLFSVLLVDLHEVVRVYSSNTDAYPLGGRKQMGQTSWGVHVITKGEPWLGKTLENLQEVFCDHALIAELGCGCCINIPVRDHVQTIGTLNLLDAAGRYDEDHLDRATKFSEPSVPLLRAVAKFWEK